MSIHIIKDLNDKIEMLLKNKQECIDFQTNLNFYVMDVTPLLESYKQMLIAPKKISFMTKKQNDNQDVRTVVKKYLEILDCSFSDEQKIIKIKVLFYESNLFRYAGLAHFANLKKIPLKELIEQDQFLSVIFMRKFCI